MRQEWMERMRQSKNSVIVGHREEIFDSGLNPLLLSNALAFGAVSVPAGIELWLRMTAVVASVDMITEFGCAAAFDGIHHFVLFG